MARLLGRLAQEERGEDVVEYGLILSFVSLLIVSAALKLGLSFEALWDFLSKSLAGAMPFGL